MILRSGSTVGFNRKVFSGKSVAFVGDSHLTDLLASSGHLNVILEDAKVESCTSSSSLESTDSLSDSESILLSKKSSS